ncbi:MAG: TonB-dependent receptor [Candidatus Omnitrophota bacterium]
MAAYGSRYSIRRFRLQGQLPSLKKTAAERSTWICHTLDETPIVSIIFSRKGEWKVISRITVKPLVCRKESLLSNGALWAFFLAFFLSMTAKAESAIVNESSPKPPKDAIELSLEELINVKITSVSKKPEKLTNAPAAVFVITQEDIKRSGATSIPEALRLAPGLQVARIDANKWAISARGFNDRYSNKLLVLIDGRTVYTPLFSGTYWESQDLLLEDVERIEIIRGPGAALWGANAVNGVINIITKNAKDTQGGLLTAGAGTEERGFSGVRYGGKLSDDAYYRIYAKYFNRDDSVNSAGDSQTDDWDAARGGFRLDWDESESDSLTLQGDFYSEELGGSYIIPELIPPYWRKFDAEDDAAGANALARWQHAFSDTSDMALQFYYDWTQHDTPIYGEDRDIFDFDFQHHYKYGERHDFVWGLGARYTSDDIGGSEIVEFNPATREDYLFNAFLQDDIMLAAEELYLTLGAKFEHNDYTGFEIQPNARLRWSPHPHHTLWASVSRAVRTPARYEHDASIVLGVFPPGDPQNPLPYPFLIWPKGDRDFTSENLIAYEMGYRCLASERLTLDAAAFYNDYHDLINTSLGTLIYEDSPTKHFILPLYADNQMKGEIYGGELTADCRLTSWWRMQLAYTYLIIQLRPVGDRVGLIYLHRIPDNPSVIRLASFESFEYRSPHNQASLRSSFDLSRDVDLDFWFRYVDAMSRIDIPSYVTLDARLAWKPRKNLEFSLCGQNLLDNHRREFETSVVHVVPTEIERSVYAMVTWRF